MNHEPPSLLLQTGRRIIIAHRGNSSFAPENTLVAFSQAVHLGADALELDIHLSADGEAVVIHDDTVDRTTDGSGALSTMTLRELQQLDAGARFTTDGGTTFPYRGRGETIPALREVLRLFPEMPLVVEIKAAAAQDRVAEIVREEGCTSRVVVASFDLGSIQVARNLGLATGAAGSELRALYLWSLLGMAGPQPEFSAIFAPRRRRRLTLPARPFVKGAARFGLPVHTWVENSPAVAQRLWRVGVTGIITDDPGLIVQARNSAYGTGVV